jgi:hypothetical protein
MAAIEGGEVQGALNGLGGVLGEVHAGDDLLVRRLRILAHDEHIHRGFADAFGGDGSDAMRLVFGAFRSHHE